VNKKTTGAWIIHHTQKLRSVNLPIADYEQINLAGKCGIVLNALSGYKETSLTNDRIKTLAKANGISVRLELPVILEELHRQRLIDKGETGITVLGLTTTQTLEHTSTIFEESSPGDCEKVAIDIAEKSSDFPVVEEDIAEYISDIYHIFSTDTEEILRQCEQIGFIDTEDVSGNQFYFNGNLFRRNDIAKASNILSSLSSDDERHVIELSNCLKASGCIAKPEAIVLLGDQLYSKLCSIGFIDESSIGNESGTFSFITRPSSFSKFTNSAADDAFDLAKAFVTSLTYGMISSPYGRGRIRMVEALMQKLIVGSWVGPATAIGQDYKVLEMKGVIEVRPAGEGRFYMRLLKKEVGELALLVITEGEVIGAPLLKLPSVSVNKYNGPETNRTIIRKRQAEPLKRGVAQLLRELRTGGLR
jgi:hypothetical protein